MISDVARINGVALNSAQDTLTPQELRQRACTELLRQAAQRAGLLDADDAPSADGVISEAASTAIEALLEREIAVPEPDEEACRRHHAANANLYRSGERVRVRHVLFAVTPGVDVAALRKRAEATFLEVRCHDGRGDERFAAAARRWSNCPSGERGGELGWLEAGDCAPEFAREIFGRPEVGVLPHLVHTRFGLHVVEVLERDRGTPQPFETVRSAAATALRRQAFVTALRQYLSVLAGE
ncbi:MAG TPA: peptidylprolyl isomerase, partial [Burkholderiales bacterium]|nr:peptidylprolyl isomerase [Burkholderiales bacterium]